MPSLVMTKSYEYEMWGVYSMTDRGSYIEFIYLPRHPRNAESVVIRPDARVPKTNMNSVEFYYIDKTASFLRQ
jgi:hypothetical protein